MNRLHLFFLAGILAATGCGGSGGGNSSPAFPALAIYSLSADFGDVAVGSSRVMGMIFSNTGGSSLTLLQNSVSGVGFTTSGIGSGVTLAPGQYVTLTVSFDPSGTGKASGMISLTSSTSSSPINLPLSGNGVDAAHLAALNWEASTSPVVVYNIYRNSVLDGSWIKVNSVPVTTTSYTDWDVQSGVFYWFAVKSVSASNVEGAFSRATTVSIP